MSKRRRQAKGGPTDHARSLMTMSALCLAAGKFDELRLHYTELVSVTITTNREENHAWN